MAFLLKRGGSAKVMYNGVEQKIDISGVFDDSPSYLYTNPLRDKINEILIELTL